MKREAMADFISRRLLYPVPREIQERFIEVDSSSLRRISDSLKRDFYGPSSARYLLTEEGRKHLEGHVIGRLQGDRRRVIPWLNRARPLARSRILEVGCGTGSSTVALAEQGAGVIAVDIARKHLDVAEERCAVYGVKPTFVEMNAARVAEVFAGERFDFIIFFAALEHMTHEERLLAMENTWNLLPAGALWVVVETPNRLHYLDQHTSLLPFFNWLPDEVAFDYGTRSPRAAFREFVSGRGRSEASLLAFRRFGRSISYHEFELAMAPLDELEVVSSLRTYTPCLRVVRQIQKRLVAKHRYEALLSRLVPDVPPVFFEPWLNLILRKR